MRQVAGSEVRQRKGGFHGEEDESRRVRSRPGHRGGRGGPGAEPGLALVGARGCPGDAGLRGLGIRGRPAPVDDERAPGDGVGPAGAEADRRPEEGAGGDRASGECEKIQQARRDIRDRQKFLAARDAIFNETAGGDPGEPDAGAVRAPGPDPAPGAGAARLRPARVSGRGGDCDAVRPWPSGSSCPTTRSKRIRAIVDAGEQEIAKAASFPIPLDPKDKPTPEAIRKLVESPEFQAAKQKASAGGPGRLGRRHPSHRGGPDRVAAQAYHKLLGAPFDLSSSDWRRRTTQQDDVDRWWPVP